MNKPKWRIIKGVNDFYTIEFGGIIKGVLPPNDVLNIQHSLKAGFTAIGIEDVNGFTYGEWYEDYCKFLDNISFL